MELLPGLFLSLLGLTLASGGPVFLSGPAADSVLLRNKRHNTGVFEELLEGDMERECIEEVCDLEEAREIFEDDRNTMEFWAGYIDGNQCKSSPCLNQGSCQDLQGSFACVCAEGFTGRRCEIVVAKRCDLSNGDCQHFCETIGTFGAKCSCASGYMLMEDGASCEPQGEFPCGRTVRTEISLASRRSLFDPEYMSPQSLGTTTPPPDNLTTTTSPPSSPASTTESPPDTTDSARGRAFQKWSPFTRIVGGASVNTGDLPWQVALVLSPAGDIFCGGSILSERWVVTAAHCLAETEGPFLVRVGEYNINLDDGTEQDYEVSEQYTHPRYNTSVSFYNHDIALLHLKSPIAFSATVRPICIGPMAFTEALVKRSSPATVSGWGRVRFLGATADTLQKVEVPYVDRTRCKQSSSTRITPFMFCAGYSHKAKDACQGDSGGPHANRLQDTWFLTGIVSWGEECAKDEKYGVYTRVSLYYRWMNHIMGLKRHRLALDMEDPDPNF